MGKRFIFDRHLRSKKYSSRRQNQILNEAEYEPHRIRPYSLTGGKFCYRSMFQQESAGNRRTERSAKKAVRRQLQKFLEE